MRSLPFLTSIVICVGVGSTSALAQPDPAAAQPPSSPPSAPGPSAAPNAASSAPTCPPGAWLCDEGTAQPSAAEPGAAGLPPESAAPPPGRVAPERPGGPALAPPPPPPSIAWGPPEPPPPPSHARSRRRSEWGTHFRLEAVDIGKADSDVAGMGGFGFSVRPRPTPHFAIDFGLDFVGGIDYRGHLRDEAALVIDPMLFVNPRNSVQLYLLGGVGFSWAQVENTGLPHVHYSYIGVNGGAGLEWRFAPRTAVSADVVGFVRGRTDPEAKRQPEYVDPWTGQTTNTSGGVMFRAGLTFYW